jgi:gas vesicle protein
MNMGHGNDSHGFLAFVVGGLVGAGITLLMAPWSGRETREKIKDTTEDVKGKAENYYSQAIERLTTAVEKGKEVLDRERFNLKSAIDAGRDAYQKQRVRSEESTGETAGTGETTV